MAILNSKKTLSLILITPLLHGCSFTYLVKTGYHQFKILNSRTPISKILQDPNVEENIKEKLRLAEEVKDFAENSLKLKKSDNYNSFVKLDSPYITYLLRVSSTYQLEAYQWSFPFVGKFPYKGYFSRDEAEDAAASFPKDKYDTYIRGVSAYSTLGWFDDPILSSMLRYDNHNLVNTIIHETVHVTIFIKGHTDFNERLASFVSYIGTELFYKMREGENSSTMKLIKDKNHDKLLFSKFISTEIRELKEWYRDNKGLITKESKSKRLKDIQDSFIKNLRSKLKSSDYDYFSEVELNNAKLLPYETYISDLSDFEKLYIKTGKDFFNMIAYLKTLEELNDPERALKEYVKNPNLK